MYPSSSSSSHQQSTSNNSASTNNNPNLMRYDSVPTALLSSTVDSFLGQGQGNQHHQFISCVNDPKLRLSSDPSTRNTLSLLHQGPYGGGTMDSSPKTTPSVGLFRHSSSPAGVFNHLTSESGFPTSKGFDVNYNGRGSSMGDHHHQHQHHHNHMPSRLGPQLSFTRKDLNSLSQISEVNNDSVLHGMSDERKRSIASQSRSNTSGFSLSTWDDSHNNSFVISTSSSKRGKNVSDDFLNGLSAQQAMELEMVTMDRLLHVPQDSVPCKIRAKRGCATHPRSIAERERRTRISGKLKKLQELVPNMDKQTSYADMLDLAVKHIKGLQSQIEKLNNDFKHCTCGCKPSV